MEYMESNFKEQKENLIIGHQDRVTIAMNIFQLTTTKDSVQI